MCILEIVQYSNILFFISQNDQRLMGIVCYVFLLFFGNHLVTHKEMKTEGSKAI